MGGDTRSLQGIEQLAARLLAGADHHVIHRQRLFLAVDADPEPAVVNA